MASEKNRTCARLHYSQRFQEILTDLLLRQNFLLPALVDKILTHRDSSVHFEYVLTEAV